MIRVPKDPSTFSWPEWLALARILHADRDRLSPPQQGLPDPPRFPEVDYLLSWLVLSESAQEARWREIFALESGRLAEEQAALPRVLEEALAIQETKIAAVSSHVLDFQKAAAVDILIP